MSQTRYILAHDLGTTGNCSRRLIGLWSRYTRGWARSKLQEARGKMQEVGGKGPVSCASHLSVGGIRVNSEVRKGGRYMLCGKMAA
jgi:hypothetical protein